MIIKVCGMREAENIRAVEALGPDWVGFICWPKSKRFVAGETPLEQLAPPSYLPTKAKRVGVFVDPTLAEVRSAQQALDLDLIQLHGTESPSFCQSVHEGLGLPIIKAFPISEVNDLLATQDYKCDYFLFDTRTPLMGGSGKQFDWSVLEHYNGTTPFLLSGGIGPDDLKRVVAFHHPLCIGIDVNSRFEISPGLKDITTLKPFIEHIHNESYQ